MKVFIILPLILLPAMPASATEQVPDIFQYEGETCELETSWEYPSPLEVYFRDSGKKLPFESKWLSTGNYRGHIATWELTNDTLYLVGITVEKYGTEDFESGRDMAGRKKIDLSKIFPNARVKDRIAASWFTGIALVRTGRHKKELKDKAYSIEYKSFVFLHFKKGRLDKKTVLTSEQHWKAVREYFDRRDTDDPVKEGPVLEYAQYIRSFSKRDAEKEDAKDVGESSDEAGQK